MLSKPLTIVVLTRDRLIRADFASARAAEPTLMVAGERPHIDDPVALVETAISLDRRKPGRVLILSSDLWTHTLALPAGNSRGLSPDDLLQMLNFEAEAISGISAFEATSAVLPLGEADGQRSFWITQIPSAVRDQLDEAIRKLGGKLLGIAHPGGVPYGFDGQSDLGMPGRVEFWPSAAVRIVYVDGLITKAHIDDGAVASGWIAATSDWKRRSSASRISALVSEGAVRDADDPEAEGPFLSLSDDGALRGWLSAWHRTIGAKEAAVPVVRAAVRRMTPRERNMMSLVLGLVVFAACYGHHKWVMSSIEAVTAERKVVEAPGEELAAAKTQVAALEKDLEKLGNEKRVLANNVAQTEAVFEVHRRRLAELMRRLSDDSSHDWVLQKIVGNGREITLSGTTMHPEHVMELTAAITSDFSKLGWSVEPAKQLDRTVSDAGGPWTFEIRLRDLMVPTPRATATPPSEATTPPSTIVRVPAP